MILVNCKKYNKKFQINKHTDDYYGQIQYFYSDKNSKLPVRDVLNTQGAGHKTEPHIENGSENFIKPCAQHNIKSAINRGAQYLILFTRCANKKLKEFFGDQFIVGYIQIKRALKRQKTDGKEFLAAQGDFRMVSYEDSIRVKDLFGENLSRSGISKHGRLNKEQTLEIVQDIDSKEDITDKLIDEIMRLDKDNITCDGNCGTCQSTCKRWQGQQRNMREV